MINAKLKSAGINKGEVANKLLLMLDHAWQKAEHIRKWKVRQEYYKLSNTFYLKRRYPSGKRTKNSSTGH